MKRLLQAHCLALEEEEMEIQSRPFMRSYWSNKITEPYQQLSVEEQSTKRDSSNLQATTTRHNEVMKPMPPIPSPKEEKPKLMLVCNQGEFFVKPKEVAQSLALEEASTIAEIPEEIDKSLKLWSIDTSKRVSVSDQNECRVRVGHRHLQDTYLTCIGHSDVVSDFK